MYSYAQPVASSLFRFLAYVFLQIIPSRLIRFAIPALYALHLLTTLQSYPKLRRKRFRVRRPNFIAALCFSLPTKSRIVTLANILINSLLLAAVLDLAASPFFDTARDIVFTRVGAVYPDSVKIVARHPDAVNATLQVLYREATNQSAHWKDGPWLNLTEEADWVATTRLTNLWPSTDYQYVLATADGIILSDPPPVPFRTFPDPRLHSARKLRFVASSCTVPNFPYRGPQHRRSIHGFDLLADYLQQKPADFMLFLGDFIYADVPFYIGDDREAYRRLYRRNYQSPSFKRIYEQLPVFHAYDDHEFIDNFAGNSLDAAPFANGANAYDIYAGNANYDSVHPGANYYDFQHGDVAFFVMDTRRYRSGPDAPLQTMLGASQLGALTEWLHKVNHTASFKVVVSSVPFTELFTFDAKIDTWAAYPAEKARVLAMLQSVRSVVVVSGDRHQFAAVEFAPPGGAREGGDADGNGNRVLEVSTSPLSMFYVPLVNGMDRATGDNVLMEGGGEVPRERVLEYIPKGNYKWSAFEIDTSDPERPVMRIETIIDGEVAFHLEVPGMPVKARPGLGAIASTSFVGLFERMGISQGKWF